MTFKFNPRVSGAFVEYVLGDKNISKMVKNLNLSKEEAHNLVKATLIKGLNDFKVDINEVINNINDAADAALEEAEKA